tara:strand:+ start:35592 stop:36437 length:846 start_codon:yes stop_codon:yes gene_type:complete
MRFLIEILIKYHVFIIFIFLFLFCLTLILKINPYNEANALNIFRNIIYNSKSLENKVTQYINLKNINSNLEQANCKLTEENEFLKFENNELKTYKEFARSIQSPQNKRYKFIPAQVENTSWALPNNTIILNKGSRNGIKKNMGVFNNNGIIGVVSNTTNNFCEVTTIISKYSKLLTSIKTNNGIVEEGVLKWDGANYKIATLEGVGNEIKISNGDSIFTSSKSKSFYDGIFIGTILNFQNKKSSNSHKIDVLIGVDFKNINSALIIIDDLSSEINSLNEKY